MPAVLVALLFALFEFRAVAGAAEPVRKLLVANSAGNDIHVVDAATNLVIKQLKVGPQPPASVVHGLLHQHGPLTLFLSR